MRGIGDCACRGSLLQRIANVQCRGHPVCAGYVCDIILLSCAILCGLVALSTFWPQQAFGDCRGGPPNFLHPVWILRSLACLLQFIGSQLCKLASRPVLFLLPPFALRCCGPRQFLYCALFSFMTSSLSPATHTNSAFLSALVSVYARLAAAAHHPACPLMYAPNCSHKPWHLVALEGIFLRLYQNTRFGQKYLILGTCVAPQRLSVR